MNILCLTGWQQPHDALEAIAPGALHFDYASYGNVEAMLHALPPAPDLAVGWSLGGQLLVRAVAGGYVKPKALILLAVPYQYVADERFAHGMPTDIFDAFRTDYRRQPEKTLKRFHLLMALGDRNAVRVAAALDGNRKIWDQGLFWLDELSKFSCGNLIMEHFPPTTIIQGLQDKVMDPDNAQFFHRKITADLLLWKDCAHAPHWHDGEAIRKVVQAYV